MILEGEVHSSPLCAHERVWESVAELFYGTAQVRVLTLVVSHRAGASLLRNQAVFPEHAWLGGRVQLRYQYGGKNGNAFSTFLENPIADVFGGGDGAVPTPAQQEEQAAEAKAKAELRKKKPDPKKKGKSTLDKKKEKKKSKKVGVFTDSYEGIKFWKKHNIDFIEYGSDLQLFSIAIKNLISQND